MPVDGLLEHARGRLSVASSHVQSDESADDTRLERRISQLLQDVTSGCQLTLRSTIKQNIPLSLYVHLESLI